MRGYVRAIGGELELTVRLPDHPALRLQHLSDALGHAPRKAKHKIANGALLLQHCAVPFRLRLRQLHHIPAPQEPINGDLEAIGEICDMVRTRCAPSRPCEGLGRSAYSRPGGAAPLCYPADVTGGEGLDWRKAHETNAAAN